MSEPQDWFIVRCPDCGSWYDLCSRVFEKYGCVTCKMLAYEKEHGVLSRTTVVE